MAPRGQPPKPLERRALEARGDGRTVRGRRPVSAALALAPAAELPVMPEGLGERGEAEWYKLWTAGRWLRGDQDYHWAEQVVRAYDDMAAFRERVARDGLIARGSMGQVIAHPLIAEIRKCEDTIRRCLSSLGFSPADRARLGLQEAKAQSALAGLQDKARANQQRGGGGAR